MVNRYVFHIPLLQFNVLNARLVRLNVDRVDGDQSVVAGTDADVALGGDRVAVPV